MNMLIKHLTIAAAAMLVSTAIVAEETTAPAAEAPVATPPLQEGVQLSRGGVGRALFTTNIVDREPADEIATLQGEERRVYFFTELNDMVGHAASHQWAYDGRFMGEVKFNVQGPRWRVWSYKTISPAAAGTWTVKVLNNAGDVIAEKTLVAE